MDDPPNWNSTDDAGLFCMCKNSFWLYRQSADDRLIMKSKWKLFPRPNITKYEPFRYKKIDINGQPKRCRRQEVQNCVVVFVPNPFVYSRVIRPFESQQNR